TPYLFLTAPRPPHIYTLSLHDALPICIGQGAGRHVVGVAVLPIRGKEPAGPQTPQGSRQQPAGFQVGRQRTVGKAQVLPAVDARSEEHTSELQSQSNLVCRLLLEKKKR